MTWLVAIGSWSSIFTAVFTGLSKILELTFLLDFVPIFGPIVSFFANFGTVELFGRSIQKHFYNLLQMKKW